MSRPGQYKTGDGFQFLGIPPKGEPRDIEENWEYCRTYRFQFLGIPPKGERACVLVSSGGCRVFPISRDPPEGGTKRRLRYTQFLREVSNF